ncbi:MAG: DedA family protein [Gammaproteobacteria bacterium]|nr:DedA family protein [Gammaproteobacteria bacterium]MBU1645545.1 DedA family protein [Gammaproteobacteria bacterium]MBU1973653.1 DedA family protein [Gammaproteobacteria bacterium]
MDFLSLLGTPEAGLFGLFLASFLAATLLPGGSEAVLLALLLARPEQALPALLLATVGNTLGGMTTYWMARALPQKLGAGATAKYLKPLQRYGPPALLLAWAPLVGDALCAAAGWLRLPWLACALWMAAGKAARYGVIAWAAG